MKNILLIILMSFILSGCQSSDESIQEKQDSLFQYSVLSTLLQGVYDGNMSCGELKEHGNFGLGTFNALDGEMLILDNQIYQVASDGIARVMSDDTKIPFAAITYFEADKIVAQSEVLECNELKTYIDELLPTENIAYAIKIDGLFNYVKTRSVPKQSKPYPLLVDVIKTQPTFEFTQEEGTLIGFRLPRYMGVANASGYHFHFLTKDKSAGGHVLECTTEDINIEIDYTDEWQVVLPTDSEFYNADTTDETYQ